MNKQMVRKSIYVGNQIQMGSSLQKLKSVIEDLIDTYGEKSILDIHDEYDIYLLYYELENDKEYIRKRIKKEEKDKENAIKSKEKEKREIIKQAKKLGLKIGE